MENENMFEVATRTKMRFQFKGLISVEDLWDLSVEELDAIFKSLNVKLNQAKEESLLDTKTKKDQEIKLKVEIIKYIVSTKLAESEARLKLAEKKAKKQELLSLIKEKQEKNLRENTSVEDLQKMLDELDD